MPDLNFPTSPTLNDTYSFNGKTWVWNGEGWQLQNQGAINGLVIGNVTPAAGTFTALSATGNVTGNYILGNGSQLSNLLTVSQYTTGNVSNVVPNVHGLMFDTVTGFSVTDLGGGNALITLGSTFKTWEVTGQTSLVAVGEDTVRFVAGNNIVITTNALSTPQQITFSLDSTVSVTGNITGANINGNGSGLSSITGANVTGTVANATYAVSAGSATTAGTVTSNAQANITSVGTLTSLSSTGNVTGGNLNAAGLSLSSNVVSDLNVTSNIAGGNISTAGLITATGNITGGNIMGGANVNATTHTGTTVSVTGNVTGGNTVVTTAVVVPTVRNTAALTISTSAGDLNLQPTGNVVVNSKYINGVTNPVQDQDVATKNYVDNAVSTAISYHQPVTVATTTTLATATGGTITYTQPNGAGNGVGALLTTTGSFNLIDTANVQTVGTRILVKNEANAVLNGVYTWANATNIVRSTDTNTYGAGNVSAIGLNDYFFTTGGNVNLGAAFVVSAPTGTITFGTSNIVFSTFSTSQTYTANTAAGVSLVGTVINAKVDGVTTAFDGSGNISIKASANLTTPNIGAATGTSLSVTGNITGGNILFGAGVVFGLGNIVTAGNVSGGNILTGGAISATGNITGGNLIISGSISDSGQLDINTTASNGNIVLTPNGTGNVNTPANLSVTGNIYTTGNVNIGNADGVTWANASGVRAWTYYNNATASLDTVFL
jgi:hypothetical protein